MSDGKLCPSAACEPGATLLGIVGSGGVVGYVRPRMEVDQAFVDLARAGRSPEARFRFASPCVESACAQWTGSRCGVIDEVLLDQEQGLVPTADPPACTIRRDCRWHAQWGLRACTTCPFVVTDTLADGSVVREARVPADAVPV